MRKKLLVVGNSLAFVVDKPLRRRLGIRPNREVEVRFDGRRLIIEAADDEVATPVSTGILCLDELPLAMIIDAGRVSRELCERFDMSPETLQQLSNGTMTRLMRYVGWAQIEACVQSANAEERALVYRMHICREQLRSGRSWTEAIAVALYVAPLSPAPVLTR